MTCDKLLIAISITFALLISNTLQAQTPVKGVGSHLCQAPDPFNSPRGTTWQSSPAPQLRQPTPTPYFPAAYGNQPFQEQTLETASESGGNADSGAANDNECQCPECQEKKAEKEKEEAAAKEAKAAKEALIRSQLTGDWCGRRSCLAERGIVFESSLTQFYQGVASGGAEQTFRYGGKRDLFVDLNTEKMGLWTGGSFFIHAVSWNYGQNSNADATFLAPVNASMTYPKAEPSFGVSSFWYQQALGDQGFAALVGRYDLLDVWGLFYPDYGKGLDGFMNVSSFVPFNIVLTGLPPVSNLAGFVKAGDEGVEAAFLVLENANHPTNVGLNFPNGVTILPTLRKYTKFGGLRGTHTLAAWYATGSFTSFDTNSWVDFPPGLGAIPTRGGSWSATYLAEQRLWQDPCNEKRYTNLFGYVDVADGQSNPYEVTAGCSLEWFGPFANRPGDRMGIAGFYNGLGDLSDLLSVLEPAGDVYGAEFYYNAQVTPWFNLTFDLQAVNPSFESRDVAIVPAIRGKINF